MNKIMTACTILYNMVVEDEHEYLFDTQSPPSSSTCRGDPTSKCRASFYPKRDLHDP